MNRMKRRVVKIRRIGGTVRAKSGTVPEVRIELVGDDRIVGFELKKQWTSGRVDRKTVDWNWTAYVAVTTTPRRRAASS